MSKSAFLIKLYLILKCFCADTSKSVNFSLTINMKEKLYFPNLLFTAKSVYLYNI